jgi:hypothetical protein
MPRQKPMLMSQQLRPHVPCVTVCVGNVRFKTNGDRSAGIEHEQRQWDILFYWECRLMGCGAVWVSIYQTFRGKLSPTSSGRKESASYERQQ